jgi:hypothetical protein
VMVVVVVVVVVVASVLAIKMVTAAHIQSAC